MWHPFGAEPVATDPLALCVWGSFTPRDVMTMLLKPKVLYSNWSGFGVQLSYLWRGVVRTGGGYKEHHVRLIDALARQLSGRSAGQRPRPSPSSAGRADRGPTWMRSACFGQ